MNGNIEIKVKDIVEYLLKLDQESKVILDHDGWDEEGKKTPQEIIETRGLFIPWRNEDKNYLIIQN